MEFSPALEFTFSIQHKFLLFSTAVKKMTLVQAAQNFIFSPEFINKNLSDADYVKVLYRTFMGREYDQNGLSYHLDRIKSGVRRDFVWFCILTGI